MHLECRMPSQFGVSLEYPFIRVSRTSDYFGMLNDPLPYYFLQGYITRSPSGHLPPLDPFVEIDERELRKSKPASHRLLTRGVDLVQAYSNSLSSSNVQRSSSDPASDRSRSPITVNGMGTGYVVLPY